VSLLKKENLQVVVVIPLPMGVVDEVEDHNHTMCYQDFLLEAGASLRMRIRLEAASSSLRTDLCLDLRP